MRTLIIGTIGEDVKELQSLLSQYGYYSGEIDGIYGSTLLSAVNSYQAANKLKVDGVVGYDTWESLFFSKRIRAKTLTQDDLVLAANLIDVELATLQAVMEVESKGEGFLSSGKPVILFEGHIMWKELKKRGLEPNRYQTGNEDILYEKWDKNKYRGGESEWDRLNKARNINIDAANSSASWGLFQIMGFNYYSCDEGSVSRFVEKMSNSELDQLLLSLRFMRNQGMIKSLQNKNWAEFARRYNGSEYSKNTYDVKLQTAYLKFKNS